MIKAEHLRQFLAVSNYKSLTEAASVLNRSPSAVSMTLKLIENHLGQALFEGDRKKVLTPMGELVYQQASKAITEYDKALSEIERFSSGTLGSIDIATVPSVAVLLLPKVMSQLCLQFPDVRMSLRDIDSIEVARAVQEQSIDFGIASLSHGSKELQATLLTEEPFVCFLPKEHPLANSTKPLTFYEIAKYPFITNPLIKQIHNADIEMLYRQSVMNIRNIASLVAFIREGLGITLLPNITTLLAPDLITKPIADTNIKRRLYVLQHHDRSLSPIAEIFKKNICDALKKLLLSSNSRIQQRIKNS